MTLCVPRSHVEGRRFPRSAASSVAAGLGRDGFTLFELTVAAVLLAAVMLTAIPTLAWVVRVRQAAERQQAAVLGVGNLMERLTALPWEELTDERVAEFQLPESLARQLPEHSLRIFVNTPADDPDAKHIQIELRWQETASRTQSPPIRLSAWAYRDSRDRGTS